MIEYLTKGEEEAIRHRLFRDVAALNRHASAGPILQQHPDALRIAMDNTNNNLLQRIGRSISFLDQTPAYVSHTPEYGTLANHWSLAWGWIGLDHEQGAKLTLLRLITLEPDVVYTEQRVHTTANGCYVGLDTAAQTSQSFLLEQYEGQEQYRLSMLGATASARLVDELHMARLHFDPN